MDAIQVSLLNKDLNILVRIIHLCIRLGISIDFRLLIHIVSPYVIG